MSPSRSTPPASFTSAAAIFRAVPPGSRRCRSQRQYLRAAGALIEAQPWNAQRKAHYAAIMRVLARHMNWADRTSRPGHGGLGALGRQRAGRIADLIGVSPDTVGRCVAWARSVGLLGLVSPGTTAQFRPGVLYFGSGPLAAVYVLCVPRRRSQTRRVVAGQRKVADPTTDRRSVVDRPYARQAQVKIKGEKAPAPRGLPMLPPASPALHRCPQNRSEGLAAAGVVQELIPSLQRLSPEHVRWIAKPFWRTGRWSPADLAHAIDHEPSGRLHGWTAEVHSPSGWARSRLALWLGPDGVPLQSRGQLAAEAHRQDLEEAARRRDGRREPAGYPEGPALARQLLAERLAAIRSLPRPGSRPA